MGMERMSDTLSENYSKLNKRYQEIKNQLADLEAKLAESEKKHLIDEKEWQDYCAFKHIEPQIKGCLDREREYEKQLAEKEKEIEYQESMKILAIENKNQKAKENEILNIALDLACQTLYDINFKLYNTEMDFKEYYKQQALTHQHEDKGE